MKEGAGPPSRPPCPGGRAPGVPQGRLPPSSPSLSSPCAGEVQAFYEDLSGRQYVNEIFNLSVDKLYDLLFTDSPFQRDFMEQRRFSGLLPPPPGPALVPHPLLQVCLVPGLPRACGWATPPRAAEAQRSGL